MITQIWRIKQLEYAEHEHRDRNKVQIHVEHLDCQYPQEVRVQAPGGADDERAHHGSGKARGCYAHARDFYEGVETAQVDSGPSIFRLKTEVGATTYVKRYLICDSAIVRMCTIAA